MNNIKEINHPLIKHYISNIRDYTLPANLFRQYVGSIANILFYEAIRDMENCQKNITTWIGEGQYPCIEEKDFVFIPILRAALPMLDGILIHLPNASAGFLAMKRDEKTLKSKIYYDRIPSLENRTAILLDPMVATGGSLSDAISLIKTKNPKNIICLNLVGSPVGLKNLSKEHPDIPVLIAQIDEELNSEGFIIPGIGDAGDIAYNTL